MFLLHQMLARRHLKSPRIELRTLAQSLLQGEPDSWLVFEDALQEFTNWGRTAMNLERGKAYLLTTVTFYWLGIVEHCDACEVVLREASWIPDTGIFSVCVSDGTVISVEPVPSSQKVHLNQVMLMAAVEWPFALPRERRVITRRPPATTRSSDPDPDDDDGDEEE